MSSDVSYVKRILSSKYTVIVIILIVSIGVYLNTLPNEFVYDDKAQVLENQWIRDVKNVPEIFLSDVWAFVGEEKLSNYYRPLMHIIYMIDYHIFGLKPWGFHLTNILFHAGVALLIYLIVSMLINQPHDLNSKFQIQHPKSNILNLKSEILNPPFIAALLFAAHPIHTEAVTWVAGIPELSFTLFYLLSFYFYTNSNKRWGKGFILSLIFFFLSILCKETALTLPILLFVYDYSFRKDTLLPLSSKTLYHLLKRYFPYLIVSIIYLILRIYALKGFAPEKKYAMLSSYELFINVFPLFIKYLEKLILPINMNAFYVFHPISSIFQWKGLIALIFTLGFIFLIYFFRRHKVVFLSLLWIVIPLLPVLYIPALGLNTFTDRYLYLPSIGFVILISTAMERIYSLKILGRSANYVIISILIILTGLYSVGTIKRNYIWKDNYSLWTDTTKKSPDSDMAHNNLGLAYHNRNLIDKAIEHYQIALGLQPDFPEAHNNMGLVYYEQQRFEDAIKEYMIAIRLRPDAPLFHYNLGIVYSKQGRLDEAIKECITAIKLNHDPPEPHNDLGNIYAKYGRFDEAVKEYTIALRLKPDYAEAHNNLGNIYAIQGKLDEAIKEYLIVLKLTPEDAETHNNIANAYIEKGEIDKSIEHYDIALKFNPNYYEAHYSLGLAYLKKGLKLKAEEEFKTALKLRPDFTPAREALESIK